MTTGRINQVSTLTQHPAQRCATFPTAVERQQHIALNIRFNILWPSGRVHLFFVRLLQQPKQSITNGSSSRMHAILTWSKPIMAEPILRISIGQMNLRNISPIEASHHLIERCHDEITSDQMNNKKSFTLLPPAKNYSNPINKWLTLIKSKLDCFVLLWRWLVVLDHSAILQ